MNALCFDQVDASRGAGAHRVRALQEVTLQVSEGELVVLDGPSGSGKTTLLALAGGLLTPDAGTVRLENTDLAKLPAADRRRLRARRVGFVFQHGNLLSALTARQNVLLGGLLAGLDRDECRSAAEELFDRLAIGDLADRRPDSLSGGEEMRVAVARALVHSPALVLADEPSASLDGDSALAVAEALARLAGGRGSAVLVATHDARLLPFASRRIGLIDGRITSGEPHV